MSTRAELYSIAMKAANARASSFKVDSKCIGSIDQDGDLCLSTECMFLKPLDALAFARWINDIWGYPDAE